ncbi:MAG: FapA family protein [Firmicutes bacterium]|nr:DUF342 domain-containing protein [Alicyclobacillaceae bacterium]MCL6498380.1 FapA family protein [Bacillota bacterium]
MIRWRRPRRWEAGEHADLPTIPWRIRWVGAIRHGWDHLLRTARFWRTHVTQAALRRWTHGYTTPLPRPAATMMEHAHWHWGAAWVDEQGHIQVRNPRAAPGVYPVLVVPEDGLRVWVNGAAVRGDVVVQEGDHIEVACDRVPAHASFAITVDPAGLEATITLDYAPGVERHLPPTAPQWRLALCPTTAIVMPPPIPLADVRTALDRQGIHIGRWTDEALAALLAHGQSGQWVIARGRPPDPGEADRYDPVPRLPAVRRFGDISWEEPDRVEPGTIVGVLRPGRPARPGLTVWGTPLHPPAPPAPALTIGPGIAPMQGGTHLVAQHAGRLVWVGEHVTVVPEILRLERVEGTLFVASGDAIVGSVGRRARVCVAGNLTILGSVDDAEVVVGGRLRVFGPVLRSQIWHGTPAADYTALQAIGAALRRALTALQEACDQVMRHTGGASWPQTAVVAWLLQAKFPQIAQQATALRNALRRPPYRTDAWARVWGEPLLAALHTLLRRPEAGGGALDAVVPALDAALREWQAGAPAGLAAGGDARLAAVAYSTIASGRTVILDHADGSDVDAADAVEVHGAWAGGSVTAGRAISIHTAGSAWRETPTTVVLRDARGRCAIYRCYPATKILVGPHLWEVSEELRHWIWEAGALRREGLDEA